MYRRLWPILLSTAVCLACTPAVAGAGVPYVLGNSDHPYPSVTADPDGTKFHVVWSDSGANVYRYCQVLVTQAGCAVSSVIPNQDVGSTGAAVDPEEATIVTDPNGGPLHLIMPQYISGKIYEAVSLNEGASFSVPQLVHNKTKGSLGVGAGRPILESDGQTSLVPRGFNGGLQLADTAGDDLLELDSTGQSPVTGYNVSVAGVSAGTVASNDDLESVFAYFAPAGSPLLSAPSWTPSTLITAGNDSTMAGNGTDAFLAYTVGPAGTRRLEIRQWGEKGFGGAPKIVEKTNGYVADVTVSPNGFAGIVYRRNDTGLRFAEINVDGKYVPKTIATTDEIFGDVQVAVNDQGKGLAVWPRDGAIAAADLTEVKDPSAPQVSKIKSKHGITLGLNVPGSCVVAGKSFHVSTGGQGVGKLDKVVYSVQGGGSETDKKNPWGLSLKVPAGAQPGERLAVTAKFFVERKKAPKKFTFSVASSVDVCGG